MSVYYYEPYYYFDRLFDEVFARQAGQQQSQQPQQQRLAHHEENQVERAFKPRMDLHENNDTNTVTASFEFPGIKKEDVSIDVHNGRLTVSAESKISEEHEHEGYAVRERRFGKYTRTLQLPSGIKEEDIKAAMADGVLTVTFPKTGVAPERKKISIA